MLSPRVDNEYACNLPVTRGAISGVRKDLEHQLLVGKASAPADLFALAFRGGASAALYGSLRFARFDLDRTPIARLKSFEVSEVFS